MKDKTVLCIVIQVVLVHNILASKEIAKKGDVKSAENKIIKPVLEESQTDVVETTDVWNLEVTTSPLTTNDVGTDETPSDTTDMYATSSDGKDATTSKSVPKKHFHSKHGRFQGKHKKHLGHKRNANRNNKTSPGAKAHSRVHNKRPDSIRTQSKDRNSFIKQGLHAANKRIRQNYLAQQRQRQEAHRKNLMIQNRQKMINSQMQAKKSRQGIRQGKGVARKIHRNIKNHRKRVGGLVAKSFGNPDERVAVNIRKVGRDSRRLKHDVKKLDRMGVQVRGISVIGKHGGGQRKPTFRQRKQSHMKHMKNRNLQLL